MAKHVYRYDDIATKVHTHRLYRSYRETYGPMISSIAHSVLAIYYSSSYEHDDLVNTAITRTREFIDEYELEQGVPLIKYLSSRGRIMFYSMMREEHSAQAKFEFSIIPSEAEMEAMNYGNVVDFTEQEDESEDFLMSIKRLVDRHKLSIEAARAIIHIVVDGGNLRAIQKHYGYTFHKINNICREIEKKSHYGAENAIVHKRIIQFSDFSYAR